MTSPKPPTPALIEALDALSGSILRAWSTEDLQKFESLAYHWASLAACELHDRRRISREEESE